MLSLTLIDGGMQQRKPGLLPTGEAYRDAALRVVAALNNCESQLMAAEASENELEVARAERNHRRLFGDFQSLSRIIMGGEVASASDLEARAVLAGYWLRNRIGAAIDAPPHLATLDESRGPDEDAFIGVVLAVLWLARKGEGRPNG